MSNNPNIRTTRLENGMRVVTHEMPHLETVALGAWVNAGARHESVAEHGVAHYLEHMAFKGTKRRSALQIAHEIEAVGGDLNAATSMESTAYFARVLKGDLALAVDVLGDILVNPVFDPDEMQRECGVIVQEIAAAQDTPDDTVFDLFQEAAFPAQALGRPILGTVESVTGFRAADLVQYRDKNYNPSAIVFAAAGALEHDQLVDLAAKVQIEGGRDPVETVTSRYEGGERRLNKDLEQAHFMLGFKAPSYTDDDFYAAQILASVLGGGMSSRLFQEVREKRGLCYSIFSFCWGYADNGLFGVYAGTSPGDLEELVPVVSEELNRVSQDLTEGEVAKSRAQLKAGLLMSLESCSARTEQIARQELVFDRVLSIQELTERVDNVDVDMVRRMADRICSGSKPTISAIGPITQLASYDKIAAKFG